MAQRRQAVGGDADRARELFHYLPFLSRFARGLHDSLGHLGKRRGEETHQRHRNVLALEEGRRRQDVIRVAVRLVHVEVERDHQVELAEGFFERVAVGHGEHGVARRHEQRADLPLARSRDLARQQRRRQVAEHVRDVSEARVDLSVGVETRLLSDLVERDRRITEHGSARPVEVAGDGVEGVQQERDEGPEATQAGAGAAVGGDCPRSRNRVRAHATAPRRLRCAIRSAPAGRQLPAV